MRLLNNLYVLTGPCYGLLSHIFGIKYSGGLILIDAGMKGQSEAQLEKWIRYWKLENEKVTHVLLTHSHWDHVGMAAEFREKGALIAAHEGDLYNIETGGPLPDDPDQKAWPACKIDILLKGDCKLPIGELDFEVIHVPGHTPGSVIYRVNLDGKDVWFVGDFICPDGKPEHNNHLWWCGDQRFSSKDIIESSRKIWKMHPDCVLGGHGYLRMDGCEHIPQDNYYNILLALPSR